MARVSFFDDGSLGALAVAQAEEAENGVDDAATAEDGADEEEEEQANKDANDNAGDGTSR